MEDNFLIVAKRAALRAGKIISKYFGKELMYKFKNEDKSDFATQADLESEQKVVQILTKNFPDHNIIAEESGMVDKSSQYTWAIDPLDGTFSFAVGLPYFAVSIGLLKNNHPILGVTYSAPMDQLFWAQKNRGSYLNGKKLHVSARNKLEQTAGCLDYGHIKRRQNKIDKYITSWITKIGYPYSFGSAVTTLGMLAQGSLDLFVSEGWIWDFAAGTVIVKEAGGVVTDFSGQEPDWSKERFDIVASNGLIHDRILEELKG